MTKANPWRHQSYLAKYDDNNDDMVLSMSQEIYAVSICYNHVTKLTYTPHIWSHVIFYFTCGLINGKVSIEKCARSPEPINKETMTLGKKKKVL